jgi:hypothetical protein
MTFRSIELAFATAALIEMLDRFTEIVPPERGYRFER